MVNGEKHLNETDGKGFLHRVWRYLRDTRGLINTTDLLVASGATIILAAGVGAATLQGLDQAKLGKAQPDAQGIAAAMQSFFKDTGKWPAQAEVAATPTAPLFLASNTATTTGAVLPSFGSGSPFSTTAATCAKNSLEGFASGSVTISALAQPTDFSSFKNINDYLVRKPSATDYPNWRGPYLQAEISSDPFGRVWLINTMPLFCAETVTADTSSTGVNTAANLGYAWILSAGPNRTLTTALTSAKLDQSGDDAGMNIGKLVARTNTSGF